MFECGQELTEAEIEIYQFPDCDSDEDDDFKEQNEKLKHSLPFALVFTCHYHWSNIMN